MLNSIHIKDFRSFQGVHDVPIAPLTLLVGENSTGKSTFLALNQLARDLIDRFADLEFNEKPFSLGSFDDIFCHNSDADNTSGSFEIGASLTAEESVSRMLGIMDYGIHKISYESVFQRFHGHPSLKIIHVYSDKESLNINLELESEANDSIYRIKASGIAFSKRGGNFVYEVPRSRRNWIIDLLRYLESSDLDRSDINKIGFGANIQHVLNLIGYNIEKIQRPYAFSPLRTMPSRTYDSLSVHPSSDGSHIPQVLSRLAIEGGETWKRVRERLEKFGKDSGLFSKLIVRHLGDRRTRDSDPFQIQIGFQSFKGKPNLVDVGYGISQVLPVILDSIEFDSQKRDFLLIQQPEVHLHPRAQAELGTFYFNEIKPNKRILIETHSDHLIDRVRMEARDAKGEYHENHKHVLILYFERVHGATKIHPIRISETGDLIDVPDGYRDFFMTEQIRFLGF